MSKNLEIKKARAVLKLAEKICLASVSAGKVPDVERCAVDAAIVLKAGEDYLVEAGLPSSLLYEDE